MRKIIFTLLAILCCAIPAAGQTGQDSIAVTLRPCRVFTVAGPTTTTTGYFFKVRGTCNVPVEATAIFAQLVTRSSTQGESFVWAFATTTPAVAQLHYPGGMKVTDGRAWVALCDPEPECGTADIELRTTTGVDYFYLNVEGYLKPAPQ